MMNSGTNLYQVAIPRKRDKSGVFYMGGGIKKTYVYLRNDEYEPLISSF